jgi:hypothetical protein
MKTIFAAILIALVLHAAPALAKSPTTSPLVGVWSLDTGKLPMPPEARPKSVTLNFKDAGGGKWATQVDIVDQNGGTMHSESTLSLDGTPGQATGNYWVDVCSATMPVPNVLVMQFAYKGNPASTRVYTVTADGALIETEAFFKKDGTPALRTAVFNRKPI